MVPTTTAALVIFLTAIVPGYITIYLWSKNKTWKGLQNDLQMVIKAISLSAVIQVLLLPYTSVLLAPVRDHIDQHPLRLAGWLVLTTLILPYLLGRIAARVTDHLFDPAAIFSDLDLTTWPGRLQAVGKWISRPSAQPSVWDWAVVAKKLDGCYAIVTWKDGTKIAGSYGVGSVAWTTPEEQGLFLKSEWLLNDQDGFTEPVVNSAGILIPSLADVRSIRLLYGGAAEEDAAEKTAAATTDPTPTGREEGRLQLIPEPKWATAGLREQTGSADNAAEEDLTGEENAES